MAQHDQDGIMNLIERFTKSVVSTFQANNIDPEPHAVASLVKTMFEEYYKGDAQKYQQEHESELVLLACREKKNVHIHIG